SAGIIARYDDLLASGRSAVPCGDPVPPPELPGDAPVADVLEPVLVDFGVAVGCEAHPAVARCGERRLRQRLHLHEPLIREPRLDHRVATIAVRYGGLIILHPIEKACIAQCTDHTIP